MAEFWQTGDTAMFAYLTDRLMSLPRLARGLFTQAFDVAQARAEIRKAERRKAHLDWTEAGQMARRRAARR